MQPLEYFPKKIMTKSDQKPFNITKHLLYVMSLINYDNFQQYLTNLYLKFTAFIRNITVLSEICKIEKL